MNVRGRGGGMIHGNGGGRMYGSGAEGMNPVCRVALSACRLPGKL